MGSYLRHFVAEAVGTYFLVFIGTGVAIQFSLAKSLNIGGPGWLSVALAFGVVLLVLVNALAHISKAHFNPAVTFGLAISGNFPWKEVPIYWVAQMLGAITGSATMVLIFDLALLHQTKFAATYPVAGVPTYWAGFIEAIVTSLLMFTIMSVATDDRASTAVAGLSVGLALFCGIMLAGPLTGGALNPARAFGPMIMAGDFRAWPAYLFGPFVGATLAALLYKWLKPAAPPEPA